MTELGDTIPPTATGPDILWQPTPEAAARSRLAEFQDWLDRDHGVATADYEQLWLWSVEQPSQFWAALWDFFDVKASAPYEAVLASTDMPGAQWFPGARLNYAEQIFARANDERPALLALSEDQQLREISWGELRQQV